MTDNIPKKHVERTSKELVAEVYPADKPYRDLADKKDMKRGKKYYEAAGHILSALVADGDCVTIDAAGCQRKISRKIREKHADHMLALKDNRGALRASRLVRHYASIQHASG